MLMHASVTNALVTLATNIIHDLGLAGVFLMIFSSSVILVPGTEATMLFSGFDAYNGTLPIVWVIVAGVLGDVVGGAVAYVIGRRGLHDVLNRLPGPFHVGPHEMELAQSWFERYGAVAVLVSRCMPVVRSAPPYAAGTARMPFGKFIGFATVGSIVWIGVLSLLGEVVGTQWKTWKSHLEYVDYLGAAVIVAAVGYVVYRWARRRRAAIARL